MSARAHAVMTHTVHAYAAVRWGAAHSHSHRHESRNTAESPMRDKRVNTPRVTAMCIIHAK